MSKITAKILGKHCSVYW